ncbi:unnamed protein product [Owenia fusiformis]|uniref:Uncharacterized protein n=1 Tax=Owenia fusiformis TaxID=6347 RepID=A0A8J1USG7_OWEFU|nr:unnamed protein product [Owenia fusiformis]
MVNVTSQREDNNANMQHKPKQKRAKLLKVKTDPDWLSASPLLRRQTRTIASGGTKEFVWWETDPQHKQWDSIAFGGKREFKWWESDTEDDAENETTSKRKSRSEGDALTPTAPPDIERGDPKVECNDVIMSLVTEEQLQIKAESRDPSPDVSCMNLFKWKSRKSKSKEKKKSKVKNQVLTNGNPKAGVQGTIPNINDVAHSIANGHNVNDQVSNDLNDEIKVETEIPLGSAISKPENNSMESSETKDLEIDNLTNKNPSESGDKPPDSKVAQNELNENRAKRNRPPLQKQLSIGKGGKGVLPWWDVSLDVHDKPGDSSPIATAQSEHWQKYGPTLGKTSTGLLAAGAAVGCKTGKVRDKVGKPHKELCRYDRDYYFNDFGGTFGERPNAEYGGESYKKANRR